jgi:REP element-mobilizing transposase RayT
LIFERPADLGNVLGMARKLRPYSPNGFFHVTARTQGRAEWFDETMRDHICDAIAIVQQRCDVRLAAFVVMPNHLHFAQQQGDYPIFKFMQPLLCRIAAAVKKKYAIDGHVFQRRYWSCPCGSPDYLKTCIEYIHRNPVKAGICADPGEYRWSSHAAYAGKSLATRVVVEPITEFCQPNAARLVSLPIRCNCVVRPARDLGDVVDYVLRRFDPPIDLELLRNMRGRLAARIRSECIKHAALAGYRNAQIARYLKVSDSVVSKVIVELRQNRSANAVFLNRSKSEGGNGVRKK